jgi:hypothetical protein
MDVLPRIREVENFAPLATLEQTMGYVQRYYPATQLRPPDIMMC